VSLEQLHQFWLKSLSRSPGTCGLCKSDKPSPEANKQTSKAVKEVSFEEKHKDWPAVILVHESRFTIHEDWSFETYIHRKVLIQTKEGSDLGQIPILYDADTDEVKILRAVAITPDGKEHSYARMQDISENEEYRTYSNSKRKTLFMPEVIVGTIIDLEYIKTTKRLPMPKNFWSIEHTDMPFPVKELKLSYRFPTNLGIKCKSFVPSWQPEIREKDRTTICYWEERATLRIQTTQRFFLRFLPPRTSGKASSSHRSGAGRMWRPGITGSFKRT